MSKTASVLTNGSIIIQHKPEEERVFGVIVERTQFWKHLITAGEIIFESPETEEDGITIIRDKEGRFFETYSKCVLKTKTSVQNILDILEAKGSALQELDWVADETIERCSLYLEKHFYDSVFDVLKSIDITNQEKKASELKLVYSEKLWIIKTNIKEIYKVFHKLV